MRIPIAPRSSRYGVSMTPMIDVVFLLIIFFLVSSHLARQEHLVPVDLPAASSADPTREPTAPRLTITLLRDGSGRIAGRVAAPGELSQRLADWRRSIRDDDAELRLRVDRDLPYRQIEPLLAAAADAGIWNVTFAVLEPEQP